MIDYLLPAFQDDHKKDTSYKNYIAQQRTKEHFFAYTARTLRLYDE